MFNSLFRACLASKTAFRIGHSFVSFCSLPWWLASYWSSSPRLGWTGVDSLCSAHSRGSRKLSVRFSSCSNFPVCTWNEFLYTRANFQVPRDEFSFRRTTSPSAGWVEESVLGAQYILVNSNHSFQNMQRCFWPSRHMSRSFCEEFNSLIKEIRVSLSIFFC